jgi:hypothetical protein
MSAALIRDVLIVPPLGQAPFHGWVTVHGSKIASVGDGALDLAPRQKLTPHGTSAPPAECVVARLPGG